MTLGFLLLANRLYYGENEFFIQLFILPMRLTGERALLGRNTMTKEEFGQRVTAMQNRLYRIARGYLNSEHDCLDAVSEAIFKAWQKRAALRDEKLFETWLVRILIRECVNI